LSILSKHNKTINSHHRHNRRN